VLPQCAAAFERLMRYAGLPEGAFRNLYATHAQLEKILNDPRVQGVALTGSEHAGAIVAAQAGRALKKSTMELGGADAVIVLADADLEKLGGSLFTRDTRHGAELARKLSTGMVFINHPTMVKADLPFGGIRHSGYGRELIGLGITEFVNHKLIDVVDINAPF